MHPRDTVLAELKDINAWSRSGSGTSPMTLLDYVGFIATPDSIFAFAELFYPDLVTHQGKRFLAAGFSEDIYEDWLQTGKEPQDIQRVMNHIHVSTLLQQQAVSDEVAVEVARVVATVWARTLGDDSLVAEAIGSSLADAAITFFER